ncbi:hypothetical protein [Actinopolyspora mortivallis]|uniref:Uncharacterized protein n=1 Tax=Actinopolyspora mortivallis TaxID=33906 RepID=A0A2T0H032_ACTMO|nr:hypothetical protein [Actinopolyspora mortivallis]PRW64726.1 hypothetical protein CEP50_02485 [Actinopolyspora mortivallis]
MNECGGAGQPWRDEDEEPVVTAVGRMTEALEKIERARGALYEWHQLVGAADAGLGSAIRLLRSCDRPDLADRLERELFGRNVLPGRWTFQTLEEFDDGYWSRFRELECWLRTELLDGARHVHEARMKARERSEDAAGAPLPGFESSPEELP